MRIPPALAAAAGAAALLAALTGCGGAGSPAPTAATTSATGGADAAALVGPIWVVHGGGAADGAHVRFDAQTVTVTDGDRGATLAWAEQGDRLLATRSSTALGGPVPTDWLTAADRVSPSPGGWALLADGRGTTATLTPLSGPASPAPTADPLGPVVPGPGVTDAPAGAIAGRWALAGHPRTAITFTDGVWRSAASCESGTPGGGGGYRVLPGGRILVTRTTSMRFGCPITGAEPRVRANAILRVSRAASFRVRGGTLTLYDRSGAALGSLVRSPS